MYMYLAFRVWDRLLAVLAHGRPVGALVLQVVLQVLATQRHAATVGTLDRCVDAGI